MELIQCSELSSHLTDLSKIQEHITPEGHSWPRARVGYHVPTFPPRLSQEVVTLPAPHQQVGHNTQNQQGGASLPESFEVSSIPSLHLHEGSLIILVGFGARCSGAHVHPDP